VEPNRKIRVLECIRQGQVGGGESHLLSLIENLDRSIFVPVVLSFTDGPMVETLRKANVECHVIYTERPFDVTTWRTVKKFIRSKHIDIIHAHGTRANSNVIWAARSLNIPVVYTVHGWSFHDDQNPLVRGLRILGEKYLTSKSSVNISVSRSNRDSGKTVLKRFKSIVINNGINLTKFSPGNVYKDIRKEFGISENAFLVLFVARLTLQKQPLLLIEAFNDIVKRKPDLHLLVVGDGELRDEARHLADTLNLSDKITFRPFRSDIPDILAAGDIFVLPSLWEGLPIGLLEAMAMGKAIIASDVDGTNEVITHNKNGLLIEAGKSQALSAAMERLISEKKLWLSLQKNARNTVTEMYNAAFMTRQTEDVYVNIFENNNQSLKPTRWNLKESQMSKD
jgi:glycosyltransferase involved in cell wall biosynthesis